MDKESFKQGYWYGIKAGILALDENKNLIKDREGVGRIFELTVETGWWVANLNNKLQEEMESSQ